MATSPLSEGSQICDWIFWASFNREMKAPKCCKLPFWCINSQCLATIHLFPFIQPYTANISAVRYAYNHLILAQHSSQPKSREFHERNLIAIACYCFWRQSCLPSPASSYVFYLCPFCAGSMGQDHAFWQQ